MMLHEEWWKYYLAQLSNIHFGISRSQKWPHIPDLSKFDRFFNQSNFLSFCSGRAAWIVLICFIVVRNNFFTKSCMYMYISGSNCMVHTWIFMTHLVWRLISISDQLHFHQVTDNYVHMRISINATDLSLPSVSHLIFKNLFLSNLTSRHKLQFSLNSSNLISSYQITSHLIPFKLNATHITILHIMLPHFPSHCVTSIPPLRHFTSSCLTHPFLTSLNLT